ncbi:pilin [Endozoicomonas sp. ALB091]|uniref:pilin n=1 Tax=Endozoicomonas sp. ALB091 TaxID=3403073 RepID=UPI003BB49AB7
MKKQQGFTLIELMIVVAITGILAAVAIPQYQNYVGRSNVSSAVASLTSNRTSLEDYVLNFGEFPDGQTAERAAQPAQNGNPAVPFIRGERPQDLGVVQPSNGVIAFNDDGNGAGYVQFTFNVGNAAVINNDVRLYRAADGSWNCQTIINSDFVGQGCTPVQAYP